MAHGPHLLAQPVAGFRAFRLADGGEPRLLGRYADVAWPSSPDAEAVAVCAADKMPWPQYRVPTPHSAPHRDCRCGIHAYTDLDGALAELGPGLVVGLVACYGTVIPHDDGIRCGRAVLCALHDPLDRARSVAVCERTGAIRCAKARDLSGLAPEFASDLPQAVRRRSDSPLP